MFAGSLEAGLQERIGHVPETLRTEEIGCNRNKTEGTEARLGDRSDLPSTEPAQQRSFDLAVREAWVNGTPETEVRAGLTFAFSLAKMTSPIARR
jgi:hypothetical protein